MDRKIITSGCYSALLNVWSERTTFMSLGLKKKTNACFNKGVIPAKVDMLTLLCNWFAAATIYRCCQILFISVFLLIFILEKSCVPQNSGYNNYDVCTAALQKSRTRITSITNSQQCNPRHRYIPLTYRAESVSHGNTFPNHTCSPPESNGMYTK